jgi:hypothetical protein
MTKATAPTGSNRLARVQAQIDALTRQERQRSVAERLERVRSEARKEFAQGVTCAFDTRAILAAADAVERALRTEGVIR